MDLCVHFEKQLLLFLYLLNICILVFQINIFQFNSIQQYCTIELRCDGPRPLGWWHDWPQETHLSPTHAEFGRSGSYRIGVGRGVRKFGGRCFSCSPPLEWIMAEPRKYAPLHMSISRINGMSVITLNCVNNLTPSAPSFKVIQGHRNRDGLIGYLWLPINVQWQALTYLVPFLFREKRRFQSKIGNFSNHVYLTPLVKGVPVAIMQRRFGSTST